MIVLANDPICTDGRVCGKRSLSTVVDHIIAAVRWIAEHSGDLNSFFDTDNLHGVCKPCHDAKRETAERGDTATMVGGIKIL
jgi:5-methylcytosine-specific restriction endonuclease McrA